MTTIILAIKNLFNKPLNLLLSLILFSLGVGLISFLLIFNQQLNEKFTANLAGVDLVIGAKGSPLQLILCNMYHIDNPTGNINLKDAKPFLNPKHPLIKMAVPLSLGDNYRSYRIVGTNDNMIKLYKAKLASGQMWKEDLDVTIGHQVATRTGLKIGDTFTSGHGFEEDEDLAHDHAKFKVVGILAPNGAVIDQLILTNTASIWKMHDHAEKATHVEEHKDDHDHAGESAHAQEHKDDHDHAGESAHAQEHKDDHDHAGESVHAQEHKDDHDHAGESFHAQEHKDDHDHAGESFHAQEHKDDHDHAGESVHAQEHKDDHDHAGESAHAQESHEHDNSNVDLINHPEKQITSILVQYKSASNYQALNMPRMINENTAMQAAAPAYEINKLYSMIGSGTETIRYIALLIALVSMISIFISLYRSMKERKYELALMRVMGSSRNHLFGMILIEGIAIAVIGWLLGIIISHIGMAVLGKYLSEDFRYTFDAWKMIGEEWLLLAISILLGIVAALIPAIGAARTDINSTLSQS